ncbi:MAG: Rab family GTPase [Candidatus Hodarchaeota archaeon]
MEDEWVLKICSAGSYQVGKTSLIRRYAENKFDTNYIPTLGVDITTKRIVVDDQRIKLILMDTAGQELFGNNLRRSYYEGASGCIIVYDITRLETFEALDRWVSDFRSVSSSSPIVIIGNKIDLEELRQVTTQEGENWSKEQEIPFYECSAKLGGDLIPNIYVELVREYFKLL